MTTQALADVVRLAVTALLTSRGARQRDLAEVLGLSPASVSARMLGRTPFTLADLDRIARHFGLSAADLLDPRSVTS